MRKKLAAVFAVLALVAAMSIATGQSALAQGQGRSPEVCAAFLFGLDSNFALFIACVFDLAGRPEI